MGKSAPSWPPLARSFRVVEPRLADPPAVLWHVGRAGDPVHFSSIDPVEADGPGGNRFDVPGGSVLYAATDRQGAYAETVARLRPSTAMRLLRPEAGEHFMEPGAVPADWRTRRRMVRFGLEEPFPFVDLDDAQTHTFLMDQLAAELQQLGIDELDVAVVRSNNRRLTRTLARWVYTAADEYGVLRYGGIRFRSRLGEHELWAIFDGGSLTNQEELSIERDDSDLLAVANNFGLSVH